MKSLLGYDRSWAYRSMLLLAVCAVVVGLAAREYDLGFPPRWMWDEKWFPDMASDYLQGMPFFDLHPPLGKFIIAASIALFGDTPLAWRLTPLIFGCALLPLGLVLGWSLFKERVGAVLLAAFFAGETMLVVYSRTGAMDIFLVFFVLATFLAALRAESEGQVIWTAVLLGLAIAIKWAAFPVAVPVGYVLWRKGFLRQFIASLYVSAIVYILIVFAGQAVNPTGGGLAFQDRNTWVLVWDWHLRALKNLTIATPHPWGSPWWSWPLMLRPIRFFLDSTGAGEMRVILAIGNPLLWWSSTLAVVAGALELARRLVVRKWVADDPLVPIMLGYVFLLLPWVPGSRIPYIYNYLPSYAFAILALVYWLCRLWRLRPWGSWVVVVFTACALAMTLFFFPMVTGLPMSEDALLRRVWLDSWFYIDETVP